MQKFSCISEILRFSCWGIFSESPCRCQTEDTTGSTVDLGRMGRTFTPIFSIRHCRLKYLTDTYFPNFVWNPKLLFVKINIVCYLQTEPRKGCKAMMFQDVNKIRPIGSTSTTKVLLCFRFLCSLAFKLLDRICGTTYLCTYVILHLLSWSSAVFCRVNWKCKCSLSIFTPKWPAERLSLCSERAFKQNV